MGQMIDAVNPDDIPAGYNGTLAVRITVLADPAGQVFDIELGNAPVVEAVRAAHQRLAAGRWSVLYVNQTTEQAAMTAMAAEGLEWAPAALWPEPGVYEWCTDPSGNITAGRWHPVTAPLAVQRQFAWGHDLSDTADNFPARVAGYIDGPASRWPDAAWSRFVTLPDAGWSPAPDPGTPGPSERGRRMFLANDGHAQFLVTARADGGLVKCVLPSLADPAHPELAQIAAAVGNAGAVPTFLAGLPAGPTA